MENAHYFLHVTDTHLRFDAEAPDTCCTEQALRSLYQTAFAWDHRPAFVLITGDLVHEGTSADYARAKDLLAGAGRAVSYENLSRIGKP